MGDVVHVERETSGRRRLDVTGRRRWILALAVAALAAVAAAIACAAGTGNNGRGLYVSMRGSDAAAGTRSAPWRTIEKALARARPGDTIYVRRGTYSGWLTAARSGTSSAPITLAAYPGERPLLTGRLKITGSHIRVRGLVFHGQTRANRRDVLVYVSGGSDIEIAKNEIRRSWMSGVYIGPGKDVRIVGNHIHSNGVHENLDHGIYCGDSSGALIANNRIVDNLAAGIQIYPDCDSSRVTANDIRRSGKFGIILGGDGSRVSEHNVIEKNVVANNRETGIKTYWGGAVGAGNVARDNVVYGNPEGNLVGRGIAFTGNLEQPPVPVPPLGG